MTYLARHASREAFIKRGRFYLTSQKRLSVQLAWRGHRFYCGRQKVDLIRSEDSSAKEKRLGSSLVGMEIVERQGTVMYARLMLSGFTSYLTSVFHVPSDRSHSRDDKRTFRSPPRVYSRIFSFNSPRRESTRREGYTQFDDASAIVALASVNTEARVVRVVPKWTLPRKEGRKRTSGEAIIIWSSCAWRLSSQMQRFSWLSLVSFPSCEIENFRRENWQRVINERRTKTLIFSALQLLFFRSLLLFNDVWLFWSIIFLSENYFNLEWIHEDVCKDQPQGFFFFLIKLLTDSDRFVDAFLSNKLNLPSRSRANRTDIRSFNHLFPDYLLTIYTA